MSDYKGFICGWAYWFAYVIGPAAQLVAAQEIMGSWVSKDINAAVWITIFIWIPVFFNLLNVRRFGEIEFSLTVIKITTILALIVLGVVLPWGASAGTRKLGYSATDTLLPCPTTPTPGIQCLPTPGFACNFPLARRPEN